LSPLNGPSSKRGPAVRECADPTDRHRKVYIALHNKVKALFALQ
jgi:hypothetical protein